MSLFDRFSLVQRSLISSLAGLLFYAVWAFLVNIMHGPQAALKAAFVQGLYSFLITLVMTLMLEALYRLLLKLTGLYWFSAVVTVVFCCLPVFIGSWVLNLAAGTPEVFETVILGYVIGAIYSCSYVLGLVKKSQH
ncbi:MAG: hypothetical protein ACI9OI_002262 [Chitinophagales bacterium]